ncbi:MAG: LacI family DNA-binding transcriptional regulator [Ectobacillus sp.]
MATIKDIAKATGYSITTVSRALNGYSDVSEKTRQKIQQAAKELNYSPNALARSLVMQETKTIGLLVSSLTYKNSKSNFVFEMLCGINEYVGTTDFDIILFSTNSVKQHLKTYTQLCRERQVDGVILQGVKLNDPYLQEVINSDIPCVLIDIPVETSTVGYVTTNHKESAKEAVQYLIDLKHKHIAFINGYNTAYVSKLRLEGYKEALAERNIPFREEWVVDGEFSQETAREKAHMLLTQYPEITAIFCASDLMALGVLSAADNLGIHVPKRLSVIGFDDITLAEFARPALTTVAQDKYQMGYEAVKLLISMLHNETDTHYKELKNTLIIRESTAENHR